MGADDDDDYGGVNGDGDGGVGGCDGHVEQKLPLLMSQHRHRLCYK